MSVTEFLGDHVVGAVVGAIAASTTGGFIGGFFSHRKFQAFIDKRSKFKYKIIVKGKGNTVIFPLENYNPFAFQEQESKELAQEGTPPLPPNG